MRVGDHLVGAAEQRERDCEAELQLLSLNVAVKNSRTAFTVA
jgi:hypothetical protein